MSIARTIAWATKKACARRFHTHNVLRQETIGHHMHGVTMLAIIVYPDCTKEFLQAATLHDLAEGEYGDLPGHTQRILGIREKVAEMEEAEMNRFGLFTPYLTFEEKRRLKFLDSCHGCLYCIEELRRGNMDLLDVFRTFLEWVTKIEILSDNERQLFTMISEESLVYKNIKS